MALAIVLNGSKIGLSFLSLRFTQMFLTHHTLSTIVGLGALICLSSILNLWSDYYYSTLANTLSKKIRSRVMRHFVSLPFNTYKKGTLLSLKNTAIQRLDQYDDYIHFLISSGIPGSILGVSIFIGLMIYQPILIGATLTLTIPWLFIHIFLRKRTHKAIHSFYDSILSFKRYTEGIVARMPLIKYEDKEEDEFQNLEPYQDHIIKTRHHMIMAKSIMFNLQFFIQTLSFLVMAGLGAYLIQHQSLTLPELGACLVGLLMIRRILSNIVNRYGIIISGQRALEWIDHFLESELPVSTSKHPILFSGTIRAENITFSYDQTPVITQTSFTIKPGHITAIVGKNGAGKTTLLHLLLGLLSPNEGQLYADNIPYTQLDLKMLRKHISILPQDPILFEGSTHENTHYAHENSTPNSPINRLESRLQDSSILENGQNLSGGQKQYIMFQRCISKDATLYIFDEPTNHMDQHNIAPCLDHIKALKEKAAIILMSHDPNVIALADTTIYLQ